jgi:hypothetical protein
MSVTPFALYFAVQAIAAIPLPRRLGPWLAVAIISLLCLNHVTQLPRAVRATDRTNATGVVADGPESPYALKGWAAVRRYTHGDDIVAFWRVRALTLYTGRRGIQSSNLDLVRQQADFFLMKRGSTFYQPLVSESAGRSMGWTVVWQDSASVLWRIPRSSP